MRTTTLRLILAGCSILLSGCQTPQYHTPTAPVIALQASPRRATAQERQKLFQAAEEGDLGTVYRLIASGIDIDTKSKSGETALHFALANGRYAVAQWLIRSGANTDIPYADPSWGTPMRELCQREQARICIRTVNGREFYGYNEWNAERLETLRLIVTSHKNPNEGLPLHLTLGESPDSLGLGKEKIVPMLLAAGVDVNLRDEHGKTPLEYACSNIQIINNTDTKDIPYMLLRAGANPNVMSPPDPRAILPYWTPLSNAIYYKERPLVRALLAAGADPNIVEGDGKTALNRARESQDPAIRRMVEKRAEALQGGER